MRVFKLKHPARPAAVAISVLLSLTIVLSAGTAVKADQRSATSGINLNGDDIVFVNYLEDEIDPAVYDYLVKEVTTFNPCIDMTQFRILLDRNGNMESADIKARTLSSNLRDEFPYACAQTYCTYEYFNEGDNIYLKSMTYEYADFDFAKLDAEIDKVMSIIEPDMTDVQKVIAVYNYICSYAKYDYELFSQGVYDDPGDHSMYGALVNRRCVCEGFSATFKYFMDRLGVENYVVVSPSRQHVWNKVVIDGEAYNCELTDGSGNHNMIGNINHNGMLCSDKKFAEKLYDNSDAYCRSFNRQIDLPATSKKYDKAFWQDGAFRTPIHCHNGKYYFAGYSKGETRTIMTVSYGNEITKDPNILFDGIGPWHGEFGDESTINGWYGQIISIKDERIYFNTPTGISSIKTDGTDLLEEYCVKLNAGDEVYGVLDIDGEYYYGVVNEPMTINSNETEFFWMTDENKIEHPDPTEAPEETSAEASNVVPGNGEDNGDDGMLRVGNISLSVVTCIVILVSIIAVAVIVVLIVVLSKKRSKNGK